MIRTYYKASKGVSGSGIIKRLGMVFLMNYYFFGPKPVMDSFRYGVSLR